MKPLKLSYLTVKLLGKAIFAVFTGKPSHTVKIPNT